MNVADSDFMSEKLNNAGYERCNDIHKAGTIVVNTCTVRQHAEERALSFIGQLKQLKIKNKKLKIDGVIHCFTGSWEEAQEYLEMGFYLGFNGIIFKSIEGIDFKENIKKTPLDKILIETDCPYLAPPPFLNQRNEPLFVKYIAEKIAKIKDLGYEKISEITTENAKKLFNL